MSESEELESKNKVPSLPVPKPPVVKSEPVRYRALVDLRYEGKTVEAGEVVSDIPTRSIGWLIAGHHIEKVS